jgi:hypothetical protein
VHVTAETHCPTPASQIAPLAQSSFVEHLTGHFVDWPSHRYDAHFADGPRACGVHVPLFASQTPHPSSHALPQHTPLTQKRERHCAPSVHAVPLAAPESTMRTRVRHVLLLAEGSSR